MPKRTAPPPRHKRIFMYHPAGPEFEDVRTFPPVVVPTKRGDDDVFVYVESQYGDSWKRKRISEGANYPSCFIAWDDRVGEWAVHQPGSNSVDDDTIPVEALPQPNTPSLNLLHPEVRGISEIIRGESETVGERRKRRSLREWFLSLSDSNEVPDFLRDKEIS